MKFFLHKISINGCKNIDKKVSFQFCNSTIKKEMNYQSSNIKAIYGPNGSGKSAIITALYIYKRLIIDEDGLNDKYFSSLIKEVINKKNKIIDLEVIFLLELKKGEYPLVFKHKIQIGLINETVLIKKESIFKLSGYSIKDEKFKQLVEIEDGEITFINKPDSAISDLVIKSTFNLLNKYSVSVSFEKIVKFMANDKDRIVSEIEIAILAIKFLAANMVIELLDEDSHKEYITKKIFLEHHYKADSNDHSIISQLIQNYNEDKYIFSLSVEDYDGISQDEYENYKHNIMRLTKFIQIFKPNLLEIKIENKVDKDILYCKKIFVYDGYDIDIEFESTGIKKLVKLFGSLSECANGKIVFVDEIDANIHGVYFTKMIDFFKSNSLGQLCFTTHNIDAIEVLKECDHSLDFLSNDSRVSNWIKNGNKSPLKKYINGLIPYSTFNVDTIDFEILLDEE